ncbi:MAG: hypothetical protein RIB60_08300 [Phycisphaerales bacterium]
MTTPQKTQPVRTLVISDGSLAALVATAMVSEHLASAGTAASDELNGIVISAPSTPTDPGWSACERAAGRQADIYGLGFVPPDAAMRARVEAGAALPAGALESLVLTDATYNAAMHGCERVLWPAQAPVVDGEPDLTAVARVVDRATLVSRLAALDAERPEWSGLSVREVRIDTPMVDLTDSQIADLALDLRVPVDTCWWWGTDTPEAARWTPLLVPTKAAGDAEIKPRAALEQAAIRG